MRNRTKKIDKTAIALVLCFSVVALTSIFTVKANIDKLSSTQNENINYEQNEKVIESKNVNKQVPTVDSNDIQNGATTTTEKYIVPLAGKIIKEFSIDVPIYSKTLDQYIIHNGIDIASPTNTQVKAISSGYVSNVYDDDKLGLTIEIDHGNKLISRYSNLSTEKMVEIGDTIKQGQVISGIGNTSLFEILDEPHLHFELIENNENIDPHKYLKF